MKGRFTLVEDILDIESDRLWYYIPGFRGYEISDDGYIRSMKHYKKYPFGILIQPKKNKDGQIICPDDPTYELSDNNNERVLVNFSHLKYLSETTKNKIGGYPKRTCITNTGSRNQRIFIKNTKPEFSKERFFPKFNIIRKDELEVNKITKRICPIESINNPEEYYGRKNSSNHINLYDYL